MIDQFLNNGTIISIPNQKLIVGWGERTWLSKPTHSSIPHFYFPDFFMENENPWFFHEYSKEFTVDELLKLMQKSDFLDKVCWNHPDLDPFKESVKDLEHQFSSGTLEKAVPYIFHQASGEIGLNQIQSSLYQLLQPQQNSQTFLYGFWTNNEGILGATPESLFSINQEGVLETAAVAGTSQKSLENAMLSDEKIRHEHQLVIDGIVQSLENYGSVDVGSTRVLTLSKLSHLMTPIHLKNMHGVSIENVIADLHPTPALGAFPKNAGAHWLKEYAQIVPRGRYGAPVGVLFKDHFSSYVAIRNIQWKDSDVRLGVGCGVVPQSCLDEEIQELALKFSATREMLNV